MTKNKLLTIALLALVLAGCGEGLTVPAPDGAAPDVQRAACCAYFEGATSDTACWVCGPVVVCVGNSSPTSSVCPDDMPTCRGDDVREHGHGAPVFGGEMLSCTGAP
jgi:hypothetical protein